MDNLKKLSPSLDDGRPSHKGNPEDEKKDGLSELFYENGQLMSKGNLKNGKKDGFWESYHTNGQLNYK